MDSMCLPFDALLLHLESYLDFSYLRCGVSLYGCSSKAQLLLFTFDVGLLLLAATPDLGRGVAPQGTHVPWQPGYLSPASDFGQGVAPDGYASRGPSLV